MNLFQLLFLSIITFLTAEGQEFKRLELRNGQFFVGRSLDTLLNTTIPFSTSDFYFYATVSANLGAAYCQQQALNDNATIRMRILIFANQSGLNAADSTCNGYVPSKYNCQAPLCTEITSSPQTISYPLISSTNVTTLKLSSPGAISIANGSWQLNALDLLYIHNCQMINSTIDSVGWIGLGLSGNGTSNFRATNPVFSFIFNTSTGFSQIIFGYNSSYVDSSQSAIILNSDPDWKLNVSGVSFGNISSNFTQGIPLVFDVGTKKITLPQPQAGEIMSHLSGFSGMRCINDDFFSDDMISCIFTGNLSILPMLEFVLENGTIYSIPSSIYLYESPTSGTQEKEYVTKFGSFEPTAGMESAIVLGTIFLSNYYSVFRQLSPGVNTITLYSVAEDFKGNNPSSATSSSPNDDVSSNSTPLITSDPITDNDALNGSTRENSDSESDDSSNSAAIVIIIIIIIVTAIFVGFLGYKKGWWFKLKTFAGEGSMNIELKRNEMIEEVPEIA